MLRSHYRTMAENEVFDLNGLNPTHNPKPHLDQCGKEKRRVSEVPRRLCSNLLVNDWPATPWPFADDFAI